MESSVGSAGGRRGPARGVGGEDRGANGNRPVRRGSRRARRPARGMSRPKRGRVRGLVAAGTLAFFQGDADAARPCHTEAYALAAQLGDDVGIAEASIGLARVGLAESDFEAVRTWSERALAVRRALGDEEGVGQAIHHLAEGTRMSGDLPAARRLYEESMAIKTVARQRARCRARAAQPLHRRPCRGRRRRRRCEASRITPSRLKHNLGRSNPFRLVGFASVASARGDPVRAARLLGAVERQLEAAGGRDRPGGPREPQALVERVREGLGDEFDQRWREGRALSDDDAAAEALA